LLQQMEWS